MGFHFEPNTTIDRIHIRDILEALKSARLCRGPINPRVANICEDRGFLRRDPCDDRSFLLTDLGNRVRAGVVGERLPLSEATWRFEEFMEQVCASIEAYRREKTDGDVQTAWLYGSLMRKEPTVGDVDLIMEMPFMAKPGDFFSIEEDSFELRHEAIPCQEIAIISKHGVISWEFRGKPGLLPGNLSLEDPPGVVSIDTDQGRYRSGTPDEPTLMETVAAVRELIANWEAVPVPLAATLRRDLVARYTGGANKGEPAAVLLDHMEDWRSCPEGRDRFREAILQIEVEPGAFEPGF